MQVERAARGEGIEFGDDVVRCDARRVRMLNDLGLGKRDSRENRRVQPAIVAVLRCGEKGDARLVRERRGRFRTWVLHVALLRRAITRRVSVEHEARHVHLGVDDRLQGLGVHATPSGGVD
eukprot:7149202-Prymnesium_polylepis.2